MVIKIKDAKNGWMCLPRRTSIQTSKTLHNHSKIKPFWGHITSLFIVIQSGLKEILPRTIVNPKTEQWMVGLSNPWIFRSTFSGRHYLQRNVMHRYLINVKRDQFVCSRISYAVYCTVARSGEDPLNGKGGGLRGKKMKGEWWVCGTLPDLALYLANV